MVLSVLIEEVLDFLHLQHLITIVLIAEKAVQSLDLIEGE